MQLEGFGGKCKKLANCRLGCVLVLVARRNGVYFKGLVYAVVWWSVLGPAL